MEIFDKDKLTRRRFLQASGTAGAAGALGLRSAALTRSKGAEAASPIGGATKVTKSICHQCPARCGIDVYTTNGRMHAIYGNTDHPISNGKLCPKGPIGLYIPYDPDRFKGPMKRTNPKKGRNEDPMFVPISWDEALNTVAARLQSLRDNGESHRFALCYGRGWGASEAGLQGTFGKLLGSPNVAIGHSSLCADGSKVAKKLVDGNKSYSSYDYANSNYLLMFGANFLESFRPYNNNLQQWGFIRGEKSPKTRVTAVDVRVTPTTAAADRGLLLKPGTDGALALAIAHHMLVNGNWERSFVGDFVDGKNRFVAGRTLDPFNFSEKWVHGLIEWWNVELKDRTPRWAAGVTTLPEKDIIAVAQEFGTTRPAIALMERGAHNHTNGVPNAMAIHSLNALSGSMFAKGGIGYQMGPSYGGMPVDAGEFMDDWSKNGAWKKQPRIDMKGHADGYKMASSMVQELPVNHLKGAPYKLDTIMFYLTNPVFSAPDVKVWEEALKSMFVIDTSPFPGESAWMADIILPDHSWAERMHDAPTYPFQGYPIAQMRVPAIKPLHNTKSYGDTLIEIGKRMKGPMGDYYKALDSQENVMRHLAKGFEKDPGDNGVDSFEKWVEKGVWYKKPYMWRQINGEFFEWDKVTESYSKRMSAADVNAKLLKTPTGKFEFKSSKMEMEADFIMKATNRSRAKLMFPHWEEPKYTGGGDLHFISAKTAMHAEGRGGNLPQAISLMQPQAGGRKETLMEIHPQAASQRGLSDGDKVRVKSSVGELTATVRVTELVRPDTVFLPFGQGHWQHGRWAEGRGANPSSIVVNQSDRISGMATYYSAMVSVERA